MNTNLKHFLWGTFFGTFNEVFFAPLWNYSNYLWPQLYGIPVLAPIGWGVFVMLILMLSDKIKEVLWYRKPLGIALFKLPTIVIDVTLNILIMAPCEFVLSRAGVWTYNYALHENVFGMLSGYFFASVIISRLCRK
jgi:hypothetical protein